MKRAKKGDFPKKDQDTRSLWSKQKQKQKQLQEHQGSLQSLSTPVDPSSPKKRPNPKEDVKRLLPVRKIIVTAAKQSKD